jgi:hypothetical protein
LHVFDDGTLGHLTPWINRKCGGQTRIFFGWRSFRFSKEF